MSNGVVIDVPFEHPTADAATTPRAQTAASREMATLPITWIPLSGGR